VNFSLARVSARHAGCSAPGPPLAVAFDIAVSISCEGYAMDTRDGKQGTMEARHRVCGPWFLLVVNRDVSSEDREVEDCSAFPASIPQFRNIYSAIDITFARRRRFLAGESRLHYTIARLVMARCGLHGNIVVLGRSYSEASSSSGDHGS
jgi:hypothetical protein